MVGSSCKLWKQRVLSATLMLLCCIQRPFQNLANFAKCRDVLTVHISVFLAVHDEGGRVQIGLPLGGDT